MLYFFNSWRDTRAFEMVRPPRFARLAGRLRRACGPCTCSATGRRALAVVSSWRCPTAVSLPTFRAQVTNNTIKMLTDPSFSECRYSAAVPASPQAALTLLPPQRS